MGAVVESSALTPPETPMSAKPEGPVAPETKTQPSLGARLLGQLAILIFTVLVMAVALEIFLRIDFYHSKDFSMEMWKYAVRLKHPVANPQLSFQHVPNSHSFLMGADVNINSQGLRDFEYPFQKAPGTYRVLMLGDSTTFGWGVRQEDTAAKFLERKLNAHLPPGYNKVEVINSGVGNYDTVQEVTYYETQGKAFNPDLVVLVFFINDPEPVPIEHKGFLIDSSYLIAFTTNRFDGLLRRTGKRPDWKQYYSSLYDDDKPGFQACKQALQSLAASTRANGSQVLVALLPELHQINGDTYPFKAAHQKIEDVLAADKTPSLELIDGLKDHGPEEALFVTPLDDHPNAKANDLISDQLEHWIRQNLPGQNQAQLNQTQQSPANAGGRSQPARQ
jgi:lysophospholipase L1-like esterase